MNIIIKRLFSTYSGRIALTFAGELSERKVDIRPEIAHKTAGNQVKHMTPMMILLKLLW